MEELRSAKGPVTGSQDLAIALVFAWWRASDLDVVAALSGFVKFCRYLMGEKGYKYKDGLEELLHTL